LKGYRIGAERIAKDLGIELWGEYELEKRLGKVAVAEIETIEFEKTALGFLRVRRKEPR